MELSLWPFGSGDFVLPRRGAALLCFQSAAEHFWKHKDSALCCLWRSDTGATFISSSPSTHRHTVPDSSEENSFLFILAGSAKPLWLGRNELTLLARASSAELFYIASVIPVQPNPLFATEHPLQQCLTCETIATRSYV